MQILDLLVEFYASKIDFSLEYSWGLWESLSGFWESIYASESEF